MTPEEKKIGNLNGPWAMLLKIMLATYVPAIVAVLSWGSWVTVGQIKDETFRQSGERWTRADAREQSRLDAEARTEHAKMGGHSVMEARMAVAEANDARILEKLDMIHASQIELRTIVEQRP